MVVSQQTCMTSSFRWLVLYIVANFEAKLVARFRQINLNTYTPRLVEHVVVRGKVLRRESSLFPSYMFVRDDSDSLPVREILSEPGAVRFLECGGVLSRVGDDVIDSIKSMEGDGGLVWIEPEHKKAKREFLYNQRVKVAGGPLSGNFGLFQGMSNKERCSVLMSFFGHNLAVDITSEHLVAAS